MAGLVLSCVAWLLHLAAFGVLAPALVAVHRAAAAWAAGQPMPGMAGALRAALKIWRGTSFRVEGASMATTAPLLAAATALAAAGIVPGFCRGMPTAAMFDPVVLVSLLLACEAAPILGALAVGTSATGRAATGAAWDAARGFAALLLAGFAATAALGGNLDLPSAEVTPAARATLLAAATIYAVRAAAALRETPELVAEAGGPDLVLLRWAAAARAAVLLTLARDLVLPWVWPDALPDATALPRWPLGLFAWVATLLLAAGSLGVVAGTAAPARAAGRGGAALVVVAAFVLAAALLGQATP